MQVLVRIFGARQRIASLYVVQEVLMAMALDLDYLHFGWVFFATVKSFHEIKSFHKKNSFGV